MGWQADGLSYTDCSSSIGEIFTSFAPKFDVFQTYIHHHREAIVCLDSLEQKKDFARWMRETEEALNDDGKGGKKGIKSLSNIMIMPVQRMPRQVMLLQSFIQYTPVWHPDRAVCERALAAVEAVVTGVDGAIEREENMHKL